MSFPTNVIQYAEDETTQIQWQPENLNYLTSPGISSVSTIKSLSHIARSPKYDLTNTTWFIQATGFSIDNLPETISGITVTVNMNRYGRITDDTIQLCYQGELIGENYCQPVIDSNNHSLLTPHTIYGGPTDTWHITNLTPAMVADPTFGVVLRYKSHPAWPHRTSPVLYTVMLQIS
jgi:hypothetical protein